MLKIDLKALDTQIGIKLARNIFNASGQLLLAEATLLESSHLDKLLAQGITEVYIDIKAKPYHPPKKSPPAYYTPGAEVSLRLNSRIEEIFNATQKIIHDLFDCALANQP